MLASNQRSARRHKNDCNHGDTVTGKRYPERDLSRAHASCPGCYTYVCSGRAVMATMPHTPLYGSASCSVLAHNAIPLQCGVAHQRRDDTPGESRTVRETPRWSSLVSHFPVGTCRTHPSEDWTRHAMHARVHGAAPSARMANGCLHAHVPG